MVAFGFSPKSLGGDRDLQMVLCHSMNSGSVVGILMRWCDQSNPILRKIICLNFLYSQVVGTKNFGWKHLQNHSHLVKFPLLNFLYNNGTLWVYCTFA